MQTQSKLTVAQLIAQLQQFDSNAIVEGFAHNNATACYFDYTQNAVELFEKDSCDIDQDTVVLHFNVELPVVK